MNLRFAALKGDLRKHAIDAVAKLRIEVFKDWPYIYDGSLTYEQNYLSTLAASDRAVIVIAQFEQAIIGAATGCPLSEEHQGFKTPFEAAGQDPDSIFYCSESVLVPSFRGKGAGHVFFDMREDHARSLGFKSTAFCSVIRPPDHPKRNDNVVYLEAFWRKRGYQPVPGMVAQFSWRDMGEQEESAKQMQFWMKQL